MASAVCERVSSCSWSQERSSNEHPFFQGFSRGLPDGSTVDSEGYLWNCRFNGNCIVGVTPDGKIDRLVEMPVKNITTNLALHHKTTRIVRMFGHVIRTDRA